MQELINFQPKKITIMETNVQLITTMETNVQLITIMETNVQIRVN